jgi:hypothetical protein
VLLLALAACDGCKKNEPKPKTELEKLPPITQEGKNTFGCLLNGKAYIPLSFDSRAIYQLGSLQVFGNMINPTRSMELSFTENGALLTTKEYLLTDFPNSYAKSFVGNGSNSSNSFCEYMPANTYSGKMFFTKIDRIKYIVSGTFEFSTVVAGCDTLKITDGRFDIRYIP